jgi:transposase-like protein
MVTQNDIKRIVFEFYSDFVLYSETQFPNIKKQGLSHEEFVNEAIINLFDYKQKLKNQQQVITFIKNAINSIAKYEIGFLKDYNFYQKRIDDPNREILTIKNSDQLSIESKSESFIKIYELFEKARFELYGGKKICNQCKGSSFYKLNDGRYGCKNCGYKLSVTARTYVDNLKLPYSKLYKLIILIVEYKKMPTKHLAKWVGVSYKTAWLRERLILSALKTTGLRRKHEILSKLLTNSELDKNPIVLEDKGKKFDRKDVEEIKRLKNDNIYSAKEIAQTYETDTSTIYKIAKGQLYNNL